MVKIEVTADPLALTQLREALDDLGCAGVTLSEVRVMGPGANARRFRGGGFAPLRNAVRLEVVLPARRVEEALEIFGRAARVEGRGEGLILVLPLSGAVRIRTGETGEDALAQ